VKKKVRKERRERRSSTQKNTRLQKKQYFSQIFCFIAGGILIKQRFEFSKNNQLGIIINTLNLKMGRKIIDKKYLKKDIEKITRNTKKKVQKRNKIF
jgi:hypothetical protein